MFWLVRLGSIALALAGCFGLDLLAQNLPSPFPRLIMLAGLYVTLAVSLNLINGITGQFSMGHAAFYMCGAYASGALAKPVMEKFGVEGVPLMAILMVIAGLVAALAGFVVGLPSLRLKGDYLAVVTLGFGEIIRIVVQNVSVLGGAYGLDIAPKFKFVWLTWLLAIACIALCRNLLKTAHGLPFLAVREDEIASSAMGVNVTGVKVVAFMIGSAFAGAAGALLAHFEGFISPQSFPMDLSFIVLTMVVLGGTGSITGSALAAVTLYYIPEQLRDVKAVGGPAILGYTIAVFLAVWAVKRIADHFHGERPQKIGLYIGSITGGLLVGFLLSMLFKSIPALAGVSIEGSKLRMVIFAVTLIILMLLRPQGVLAHHEFSWSWVRKLLGKDAPQTAVSA